LHEAYNSVHDDVKRYTDRNCQKPVNARPVLTGLNRGSDRCWQKLANAVVLAVVQCSKASVKRCVVAVLMVADDDEGPRQPGSRRGDSLCCQEVPRESRAHQLHQDVGGCQDRRFVSRGSIL